MSKKLEDKSTLQTFRENVIAKIPLVIRKRDGECGTDLDRLRICKISHTAVYPENCCSYGGYHDERKSM